MFKSDLKALFVWSVGLLFLLGFTANAYSEDTKKYAGAEACKECHDKEFKEYKSSIHYKTFLDSKAPDAKKGCEACHGSGVEHIAAGGDKAKIVNPKKLAPEDVSKICLSCHTQKNLVQWKSSTHASKDLSCASCHDTHGGVTKKMFVKKTPELCYKCHNKVKMENNLPSHHPIVEGKISCENCHNPHGGDKGNLKAESVNELCAKCHAEKAGPFVFGHPPVEDDCGTCHKPHGSINNKLLKQQTSMLCVRCHKGPHDATKTAFNTVNNIERRYTECTRCHVMIHGSDITSRFTR